MQMISMFWVRAYTDLPGFTFPCRAKGSGDSCYNKNDPLWNVPHQLTCAVTGGRLWWSHFLGFSASSFSRMCKGERSLLSPWRHLPQCCPFMTDWIPLNCKPKSTFSFLTMPFSDILLQQWNGSENRDLLPLRGASWHELRHMCCNEPHWKPNKEVWWLI